MLLQGTVGYQGVTGEEHESDVFQIRRLNPPRRLPLAKSLLAGILASSKYTAHFHFQGISERSSLLYKLTRRRRGSTAHHNRHLNDSRLHSLVIYPVGSRRSQHARKSSTPIKEGKPPRKEKNKRRSHESLRKAQARA